MTFEGFDLYSNFLVLSCVTSVITPEVLYLQSALSQYCESKIYRTVLCFEVMHHDIKFLRLNRRLQSVP